MLKVSIITRTIGRDSLQKVIEAVKNQTHTNIEHIIIEGFDRFKAAAEGFKKITGDIVLLLDDDDIIEPTHVEGAVKKFISFEKAQWVNTGFKRMINGKFDSYQGGLAIDRFYFTHSSAFFFRASLLEKFNYLDEKYNCGCEDIAFFTDIALRYPGSFIATFTSAYHLHDSNTAGLHGKAFRPEIVKGCHEKVNAIKSLITKAERNISESVNTSSE